MIKQCLNMIRETSMRGVQTVAVIGGHSYGRPYSNLSDVDLLCLCSDTPTKILDSLCGLSAAATNGASDPDTMIVSEFRLGPFRPRFNPTRTMIQLHWLVFEMGEWDQTPLHWRLQCGGDHGVLIGQRLEPPKIASVEDIRKSILTGPDSLARAKAQLVEMCYTTSEYVQEHGRWVRRRTKYAFTDKEDQLTFLYSVINSAIRQYALLQKYLGRADVSVIPFRCVLPDTVRSRVLACQNAYFRYARIGELPEEMPMLIREGIAAIDEIIGLAKQG